MLKRVVGIFYLSVVSFCAYGQVIVLHDKEAVLTEGEAIHLFSAARPVVESVLSDTVRFWRADIFHFNNRSLLTMPGLFDVFEYREGTWVNLYGRPFIGYNFGAFKFINNNRIHSIGGYGYWRLVGEVTSFDETLGEWNLIQGTKDLPYGIVFPMKGHLVVLAEDALYKLYLNDNSIKKYRSSGVSDMYNILDGRFLSDIYDGENYAILLMDTFFLVDKVNEQIYIDESRYPWSLWLDKEKPHLHIYEDIIAVYDIDFKLITKIPFTINKQSSRLFLDTSAVRQEVSYKWTITGVIVLAILIISFFLWRRRPSKFSSDKHNHPLLIKLREFDGQRVSTEKLDELFEIPDFLSNEAQRLRRSQAIKELNTIHKDLTGKDLIFRIRNTEDQRRFFYEINFSD